jgi:probable HAF family extracellular repeat protein
MVDLGTLGGPWSQAVAVNERGQVIGSSATIGGEEHPVLWNPVREVAVSGHGRFGTDGDGQVAFTLSDESVSLRRIHGRRFAFEGAVDSVSGSEGAAIVTGVGSWNGDGGYAFAVTVTDEAPWGRLQDTIAVEIRDPAGSLAFTSLGAQVLKQGDIEVTPLTASGRDWD